MADDQHYMRGLSMSVEHDVTGYPVFRVHGMSGEQKRDMVALDGLVRLFTAAPDLLESLKLLYSEMELSGNAGSKDYGWPVAITKSRAAIAKAEGAAHVQ
jgi:hypothetical protein